MRIHFYIMFIAFLACSFSISGQNKHTFIDIESIDGGVLLPRMTTIQRLSMVNPAEGLIVYDLTQHSLFFYDGNAWNSYFLLNISNPGGKPGFWGPTWSVFGNLNAHLISNPPLFGNTDYHPIVFITDNLERMRIDEDGDITMSRNLEVGENLTVKNNVYLNTVGGMTINNGPFTVDKMSPTLLSGKLTVDKKTLLKLGLEVFGSTTLHGLFKVDNDFYSHFTGQVYIDDLTPSDSAATSTGALVVDGGVGIGQNLNIGGNMAIAGTAAFGGEVAFASPVTISAEEESVDKISGALRVTGGVGIGKRLNVGGISRLCDSLIVLGHTSLGYSLTVMGPSLLKNTLGVTGATNLMSSLGVAGATTLGATLSVAGNFNVNNKFTVNATNGSTDVAGIFRVSDKLIINSLNGNIYTKGRLDVDGGGLFLGDLEVGFPNKFRVTAINGNTAIAGDLKVNTNKFTVAAATGNTLVAGTANVAGNFGVSSNKFFVNAATGETSIYATPPGGETNFTDGYPLRIQGGMNGIAIAVSGSRTNANNYISFWDGNGAKMWGRIEGETQAEMEADVDFIIERDQLVFDQNASIVDFAFTTYELVVAASNALSSVSSSTACAGLGACVTAPIPSWIVGAGAQLLAATALEVFVAVKLGFAVSFLNRFDDHKMATNGVTYQSGAGDYAEYLLRANEDEVISYGDIVGVTGGKVSKVTTVADRMMVVSFNPIILGNMPQPGAESKYEKVAFMGQVPVKVFGRVNIGDYIIPAGSNSGIGKAVSPKSITSKDIKKIVGVAWSESESDFGMNMINVAVGTNVNDNSLIVENHEKQIASLSEEIKDLKLQISEIYEMLRQKGPYSTINPKTPEADFNTHVVENHEKSLRRQINADIEKITPDNNNISYHEYSREDIIRGIDFLERVLTIQGVNIEEDEVWKRYYTDPAFKEEMISKVQVKVQEQLQYVKEINAKN